MGYGVHDRLLITRSNNCEDKSFDEVVIQILHHGLYLFIYFIFCFEDPRVTAELSQARAKTRLRDSL